MKPKMLYKLSTILAVFLVMISSTSCKEFLELQPQNQINDESFYRTAADFESSLLGVYSSFKGFHTGNLHYINELATDNAELQWLAPTAAEVEFDDNSVTAANATVLATWNVGLYTIARCNTILNRIKGASFDPVTRDRIIGETRFFRAWSYFYLVQLFGRVPVADVEFRSPGNIAATDLSLKPQEEVYKTILDDLISAESLMPASLNADKGRVSRGTVKTLLGKVYLTKKDYALAAAKLKEVIDEKQYALVPDYKSLVVKGNNNLVESIFEIKFVSGSNLGNLYSVQFTPALSNMLLFPNNQSGGGRMVPTLNSFNAFEKADRRKAASVHDTITLLGGTKVYSRYGLKFVDFSAINVSDGNVTYPVSRFSDVLLMYAEALNEQDKTADALPYINQVRKRAGLADLTGLDKPAVRLALEKERKVEFLFEGQRWFDLVRTGRAIEVMNAHFASKGISFKMTENELLLPIPLREIDLNPALTQNPGY
ncbi:RagB/SusD family nutrient uptake outer membrane protein [Larkinella humicola]|nr:RagB/SusD family nutrient uptake outer membrane protein [Larkinella humicola]